jgi:hypothetical protein
MYFKPMTENSLSETRKQRVISFAVFFFPLLISSLIAAQILLKPVSYLFADDWLLLDYLIPSKEIGISELFQLVNGHNVLTTKLSLIILANLVGSNTLTFFALLNVSLGFVSCVLILRGLIVGKPYPFLTVIMGSLLFFNFKQAQNYNMIISAHFIHSLFVIAAYLSIQNSRYRRWRWVAVAMAPFTGGLGIVVVAMEVFFTAQSFRSGKRLTKIVSVSACLFILICSYGINLAIGNTTNNTSESNLFANVSQAFLHPWYLPSFLLSSLGAQFVPSSRFTTITSQIAGLLVVLLVLKARSYILQNKELLNCMLIVAAATLLFVISGYDGTIQSISTAHSNRYVTGTVLGGIALMVSVINIPLFPFRKIVIGTVLIASLFSGAKSGFEWVNVRSAQSQVLEKECGLSKKTHERKCFDLAFSQSFFTNEQEFNMKLQQFLNLIQRSNFTAY